MKTPDYALGIDLGGTNVKGVAVTRGGRVLGQLAVETGDTGDRAWRRNVTRLARLFETRLGAKPSGIGLAAPGLPARDQHSVAVMPGRLQGLEGLIWQEFFRVDFPVPVLNDGQAALRGECWRGAAKSRQNAVLLTLGTGVGGAVMCDGRVLRGHLGRAGHLGHVSLDPAGIPDIVNTPGSLEDAVGECTIARRGGGRFKSNRELVAAYRRGDAQAAKIWLAAIQSLAAALASFTNLFDPEIIVIGGGIARAGVALFAPLEQQVRRFEWPIGDFHVPIVPARLGNWSGAFGAAWHGLHPEAASAWAQYS